MQGTVTNQAVWNGLDVEATWTVEEDGRCILDSVRVDGVSSYEEFVEWVVSSEHPRRWLSIARVGERRAATACREVSDLAFDELHDDRDFRPDLSR